MTQNLRQQAEARLASSIRLRKCAPPRTPKRLLAHELEVHQVELELQNDELERARAESESVRARYVELYEQAPIGFVTLDGDGRIVEANAAAVALLAVDRTVLHGKPLAAFMRSADADGFHLFRQDVLRTGRTSTHETMLRCSGGALRPVHLVVSTPTGESGECRCALLDLSDLRAAEDARRAAESNARAVLDAAPDAIVTFDESGRIVSFNAAAARTFGYEQDEVLSRRVDILVRSPDLGDQAARTARGVRRDGTTFPLEVDVAEWHGRGERMFTAILRDVSEREDALALLRETKERFDAITHHVEDVFYIADVDGAVSYASVAYERIWGRPVSDVVGRHGEWPSHVVDEDRHDVEEALAALGRGDPFDVEYRIVRPDGAVRWIHDRAFAIEDQSGRVVRIVGVARDRTNERELELELRHAQKMHTIGALSSAMAHDFNNILQVMVGAAALASDDAVPREQARQFLRHARDVAMRGAELVHRITGFARKDHAHHRPVSIDDALRDTRAFLRPLLAEHIEVVVELGAPNTFVRASQVQLEQILLNLASNGRDAMPAGGTFTVRTEPQSDGVRIVVSDTGTGMDEATKARVFDPFFTTKAPGRGTGLGLATVRAVVEQLGGSVEVESEPGRGTAFTIVLPTCTPGRGAAAPDVDGVGRFVGTALLVEDEPLVRRSLRRQLEQLGVRVLEAETPERALDIARALPGPPEVVVSDVLMPGMTGPRMVAQLRERWPELGVLFVSGDPQGALEMSSIDRSTRFLPKPFDKAGLALELSELLATATATDDALSMVPSTPTPIPSSSPPPRERPRHDGDELRVVVRRRQGNGTISAFAVRAQSYGSLARTLRSLLERAEHERGRGIWSDIDPEVSIDDEIIGRLTPRTDIAAFIAAVLERVREAHS